METKVNTSFGEAKDTKDTSEQNTGCKYLHIFVVIEEQCSCVQLEVESDARSAHTEYEAEVGEKTNNLWQYYKNSKCHMKKHGNTSKDK